MLIPPRIARRKFALIFGLAIVPATISVVPAQADSQPLMPAPVASAPSYADLADMADAAQLVIRAKPRKVARVEPERAAGLKPGWVRLYIEAQTEALLGGNNPVGGRFSYLADVQPDSRGKLPDIRKPGVILFARMVPGRPGELQLVAPDAQLIWDAALETRLRGILAELYAKGAPPAVTAVREAIHVPGSLADSGETQLFLATGNGEPAAITVTRNPGQPVQWGVTFSEVVGGAGAIPARDTLGWYRLACFLPRRLPASANTSGSAEDRAAAGLDYRFVLDQLGDCPRTRQ